MILPIIVVVVLVIAGGIAFVVKSKSSRSSGEFLSAEPPRPAAAGTATRASAPPAAAPVADAAPEPDLERLVFAEPAAPAEAAVAAEPTPEPVAEEPVAEEPVAPDERPEPMVRARIAPAAPQPEPERAPDAIDEDDDQAVLSRFKTPGARVASIPIPQPVEARPAPSAEPELATDDAVVAAADEPPAVEDPAPEPEPVAIAEPEPEPIAEPEPVVMAEPDVVLDPEPMAEPEPVVMAEPDVVLDPEPVAAVDPTSPAPAAAVEVEAPAVADAPPALTGAAAMSPVLDDPIVLTDEPPLPLAKLQPEPELDPVDHVLKALIHRAKEKQVGIAEVAAELVEQANLEDRDIDEVLADLVVRADDDTVDSSERLEELTLFNDSVPRRPGQLTDFDRLDKNARKKVIIRVLCLLVAMQEDNRLKPSEPRSEAETRHWPLARAVWPVPVAADDEAEDADGDKKLPGRRLARTSTKR